MTNSRREAIRRWREKNRERVNEWARASQRRRRAKVYETEKAYRARDPEAFKFKKLQHRLKKHGLTLDQYASMSERQNFQCAVCKEEPAAVRSASRLSIDGFVIDHDHESGKVRGLLCDRCNRAAGMVRDSAVVASRLSDYLQKHANRSALQHAA